MKRFIGTSIFIITTTASSFSYSIPKEEMKQATKAMVEKMNQELSEGFPRDQAKKLETRGASELRDPSDRDAVLISLCPAILRSYIGDTISTSMAWIDFDIRMEKLDEVDEMAKYAAFMLTLQKSVPLRMRSKHQVSEFEFTTYAYNIDEVYICKDAGETYYKNAMLEDPWMYKKVFGKSIEMVYD